MSAHRLLAVLLLPLLCSWLPARALAQAQAAGTIAAEPAAEPAAAPAAAATPAPAAPVKAQTAVPAAAPAAPAAEPAAADASAAADAGTTAAADTSADLTPAELAALDLGGGEQQALDTSLHVGGFMDFSAIAVLSTDHTSPSAQLAVGDDLSFMVGSLNVYLQKDLTESLRTMAEIRFTYLPNGFTRDPAGTHLVSTSVGDYGGPAETLKWGGIEIERAYLDWSLSQWLTLRLGQFLTPYGIWNVDHGSPVVIAALRPYAVSGGFLPERQTGIEAFGRWDAFTDGTLGYHLTLSNGTGPISEYRDLDSNKAIGARVYLEYRALGVAQAGVSGYLGRDSSAALALELSPSGEIGFKKTFDSQADYQAIAFDLQWKYEGLQAQGEWVGRRALYTDEGRTPVLTAGALGVPPNALAADTFDSSGYVLLGYRFAWLGVMPFATVEYEHQTIYGLAANNTWSQIGLNIRPISEVVVKVEYVHSLDSTPLVGDVRLIIGQVAWVF
jgi:hypothetical protein